MTVPILSCLFLHQKQMVAFPDAECQLRFVALVFLSPSTACEVGPPAQVWRAQKIGMGPLWADLSQGSSIQVLTGEQRACVTIHTHLVWHPLVNKEEWNTGCAWGTDFVTLVSPRQRSGWDDSFVVFLCRYALFQP